MKKKIILLFVAFTLVFVGTASAKSIGLSLNVGGLYTNHQLHYISDGKTYDNFQHHNIFSKHMGGFSAGLSYRLPKNWALYFDTMFAFNKIFVNDTQLGFGYIFRPGKGFEIFLCGGLAIGGSKFDYTRAGITTEWKYFNVGGGLSLTASYMFTRKFGIYFGISDSYYKPVTGETRTYANDNKSGTWKALNTGNMPKYNQSINARLGLKVNF